METAERRVKVPLGSDVRLEVTADQADEVHLHGYDRKVDIEPGTPAVLEFQAANPGVFEVELEAALKLVELQVERGSSPMGEAAGPTCPSRSGWPNTRPPWC